MKKIFTFILSLVMVLSMSTVAFADGETGTTDGETATITNGGASTVDLAKIYKLLNAGTTSPAETFNFTIQNYAVSNSYYTDKDDIPSFNPSGYSIPFIKGEAKSGETTVNNVTFVGDKNTIDISLPVYDKVGVYTYIITETAGKTAGVTYDVNPLFLKVTVTQGDNSLVRTVALHYGTINNQIKTDTFENTYSAGNLVIKKNVTGNMGQREKYFAVDVTLKAPANKDVTSEISVGGFTDTRNPSSITFMGSDGKYVSEVNKTIYIKHDEEITLSNIPYGVTYTVVEKAVGDGYLAPKYKINDGEATTNSVEDSIDAASTKVEIINNKTMGVDTGILVDNLPYIIILAGVVVGIGVFFIKKRTANNN